MPKNGALFALAIAASLAGCAVDAGNRKPDTADPVYLGWRVFEDRCARCHGAAATGQGNAPDLLVRVRTLGPREFADLVLLRYRWPDGASASADRQAWVDDVTQRRRGALDMPAWQGEPQVTAHIIDLHAYLSARADGTQRPGPPPGPPQRR